MTPSTVTDPRQSDPRQSALEPELIDRSYDDRLRRIEWIAQLMDDAFVIPGTNRRIGWDSLIGLVPGIGDAATAAISVWIVHEARQLGVPRWKLARMLGNIGLDALVGSVPVAGDVFDWAFKANRKNVKIVADHFRNNPTFATRDSAGAQKVS